jgi:hypothetical protein
MTPVLPMLVRFIDYMKISMIYPEVRGSGFLENIIYQTAWHRIPEGCDLATHNFEVPTKVAAVGIKIAVPCGSLWPVVKRKMLPSHLYSEDGGSIFL